MDDPPPSSSDQCNGALAVRTRIFPRNLSGRPVANTNDILQADKTESAN